MASQDVPRLVSVSMTMGERRKTPEVWLMEPENQLLKKEIRKLKTIIFSFHIKILGV